MFKFTIWSKFTITLQVKFTNFYVIRFYVFMIFMNKRAILTKLAVSFKKKWAKSSWLFPYFSLSFLVLLYYNCMNKSAIVLIYAITLDEKWTYSLWFWFFCLSLLHVYLFIGLFLWWLFACMVLFNLGLNRYLIVWWLWERLLAIRTGIVISSSII